MRPDETAILQPIRAAGPFLRHDGDAIEGGQDNNKGEDGWQIHKDKAEEIENDGVCFRLGPSVHKIWDSDDGAHHHHAQQGQKAVPEQPACSGGEAAGHLRYKNKPQKNGH